MTTNNLNSEPTDGVRQPTAPGPKPGLTRYERYKLEMAANSPAQFLELEPAEQAALVDWIQSVLVPAKTPFRRNSYGMKHDFDREPDGFYVRNGAFKGAMVAAGFPPVGEYEVNWRFRVRPAKMLSRMEQREHGFFGRNWLARDRWRDKGYVVLQPTQRLRVLQHSRECSAERRPQIVVLRERYVARISMDTAPAGYRLTREAVAAVLAVFGEFDPKGMRSWVVNEQLAVIRRVPRHRAEEVAAALLGIAKSCAGERPLPARGIPENIPGLHTN